jgi:hypothetical protein
LHWKHHLATGPSTLTCTNKAKGNQVMPLRVLISNFFLCLLTVMTFE